MAWSDDPANHVGSEYIIQEHADGVQLHDHWLQMDTPQHMLCTKALSFKLSEMTKLDFPAYGNIYFADAPIEGASLKIPLEDGFCIGPYCSPLFWNCGAGELELYGESSPNRGPCMYKLQKRKYLTDGTLFQGGRSVNMRLGWWIQRCPVYLTNSLLPEINVLIAARSRTTGDC